MPDQARAIINGATTERDRLLLRVLWATGCRVSEALALVPRAILRDGLLLPNLKNRSRVVKTVFLPESERDLPGDLLLWAREQDLADDEPIFASRKRVDGRRRAVSRSQAWRIVKDAARRSGVTLRAIRESVDGPIGAAVPAHPHDFRHARVRQIMRTTRSLPLAQKQAGWSRLQTVYLTLSDDEARSMMAEVPD